MRDVGGESASLLQLRQPPIIEIQEEGRVPVHTEMSQRRESVSPIFQKNVGPCLQLRPYAI